MWFQWSEQREYMDMSWGCGKFLATVFVLVNLFGQLGGCVMVIIRYRVPIACGVLFFIVVLQVFSGDLQERMKYRIFFRRSPIVFCGTFSFYSEI